MAPSQTEILILRLNKLQTTLLTSGLQQSNPALYQVIKELIGAVLQSATGVIQITGGGGGGPLSDQPYVTYTNALASLPQSRQLVSGDNVTFDLTTFGELMISVLLTFITDATFLTATDESADFPNSRQLLAGTNIAFDDTVPNERTISSSGGSSVEWSVLTNGNVDNPELIFVAGDVIMVHTP